MRTRGKAYAAGVAALLLAAATQPLSAHVSARRIPAHHHAVHARHAPRTPLAAAGYGALWGTTVYGSSLPFVSGTCVDPYDPDPIGGPDRVGEGGPGGYGPQCRAQAGVIPGTTLR